MREFAGGSYRRRKPDASIIPKLVAFLLSAALLATPAAVRAAGSENVVRNGDLDVGSGDSPDGWKADGWQNGPDFSTYRWEHPKGEAAEVEVTNLRPNDARWSQTVHIGPGWYHFTASVRAKGVSSSGAGVNLSVLEDGIVSEQIHGTTDWRIVGFYIKAGSSGADIQLACRLGGYASLSTGTGYCRYIRGAKVNQPPESSNLKYDLDAVRGVQSQPPPSTPTSSDNTGTVVVLLLAALAVLAGLLGSRRFNKETLKRLFEPGEIPPAAVAIEQPRREIEIAVFAVCFLTFAYFYQASDHSTGCRFDLIRAILERHTLWIDGYAGYNTADIMTLNGHIFPAKAPGMAFTGMLPWIIVTGFLRIFMSQSGLYWALATYLTTLLSSSLIIAITAVVMYRFGLVLAVSHARSAAIGLTFGLGTIMFVYATEFTGEPVAAAAAFGAFYLLAMPPDEEIQWRSLSAGILAGWAVLCDFTTALVAVGIAAYALWRLREVRRIIPFAAGAGAIAAILLAHNEIAFGHPFFVSYEALTLPNNTQFPEATTGFIGITGLPKLEVLGDVFTYAQRGLLFCNPVLLLAIPGFYFFWRQRSVRAEFLLAASLVVVFVLLNGSMVDSIRIWGGGTATGPRHMIPVIPFMVLAMAFLPREADPLLAALAIVSAFMMVMAVSIEPHLPYEYAHPFRDFLWPAYLRGDFGYNKGSYFGGPPIAGDSIAFNLGKLARLPGWMQLWPLAALWIAGALYFLRTLGTPEWSGGRIAAAIATVAIVAIFAPPTLAKVFARPNLHEANGLLGCYYEGLNINAFPPHIKRIDSSIEFDNIAALGALPSPSTVVWKGGIIAPATGEYRFDLVVDDSGWLKIDGQPVIPDPGAVTRPHGGGTIQLTAGPHKIEIGQRNLWGDAQMHLRWQPPGSPEQIIPAQFLVPDASDCGAE